MSTHTPLQVKRALNKVPNVSDFCRRHELPVRTVWRFRCNEYTPGVTVLKVITMALESDGLLAAKAPKKKAAAA